MIYWFAIYHVWIIYNIHFLRQHYHQEHTRIWEVLCCEDRCNGSLSKIQLELNHLWLSSLSSLGSGFTYKRHRPRQRMRPCLIQISTWIIIHPYLAPRPLLWWGIGASNWTQASEQKLLKYKILEIKHNLAELWILSEFSYIKIH